MEELIKVGKSNLHLKQKNINNLTHELNALQHGKMDSKKNEWKGIAAWLYINGF